MHVKVLMLAIIMLAMPCFAEEYVHGVSKDRVAEGTASYKKMSARLDYDAVKFREYAPVPRVAEHDSAFGADEEEYEKLNTYGVMMISAQCQVPDELPLKSVYLKKDGKKYPLKCLLQKQVEPGSAVSAKTFGSSRWDAFYLIPYGYTQLKAEICIDWNINRADFVLTKLPWKFRLDFVKTAKSLKPAKGVSIGGEALKKLLVREFSLSEEEAAKAAENRK